MSRTGTLVYRRHVASSATVQWLDMTGKQEPLLARPGAYVGVPRVSPDGKRIAIAIQDGSNQDIWVYEPQRDAMTRLTSGGGLFTNPVWTRDGRHVVYALLGGGLRWSRADGAGQPQVLHAGIIEIPTAFSWDGTRLVYFVPDGNPQIWSVPIEADGGGLKAGKPERFLTTKSNDVDGTLSPDGRWLAYSSDESGIDRGVRPAVYRERVGRQRTVADLQQRWIVARMVAERPRAVVPRRRPDHDGRLHRERRLVRCGETASMGRERAHTPTGSISLLMASAWPCSCRSRRRLPRSGRIPSCSS